jgi:hypothetical protein
MPRIVRLIHALAAVLIAVPRPGPAQDTAKTFFTRHDVYWAGVGLAGGAAISIFDKRIANWWQSPSVQGSSSRHDFIKSLTVVNETPLTIGAFVTYGVGRLTGNETVAEGWRKWTSSTITDAVVNPTAECSDGYDRRAKSVKPPQN